MGASKVGVRALSVPWVRTAATGLLIEELSRPTTRLVWACAGLWETLSRSCGTTHGSMIWCRWPAMKPSAEPASGCSGIGPLEEAGGRRRAHRAPR